jgi:hypothetical protein
MSALILEHRALRLNLPAQLGNPIADEALHVIIRFIGWSGRDSDR